MEFVEYDHTYLQIAIILDENSSTIEEMKKIRSFLHSKIKHKENV